MSRITNWEGIQKQKYSYLVQVEVSPFPRRTKRFPLDTPRETMQAWRSRLRQQLERAKPRGAATGTLRADVQTYLQGWGAGKHPESVTQRRRHLGCWVEVFGDRLRMTLTTAEIEQQLRAWQQTGLPQSPHAEKRGRAGPVTPATIRKVRQALFQVFAVLDRGTGTPNPVADVPAGTDEELEPKGLSPAVVRAVLAHLPRSKTKARCYVVAYTGLRPPSEVIRIRPEDIDLAQRSLYVRSGKGSTRARLPVTRRGAAALRYFVRLQAFGTFTSSPLNRALQDAARRAAADARLPADLRRAITGALSDLTAYSLRHSFGTWHYAATHDIKATQIIMRHRTLRMTERYIRGAVDASAEQSIAQLDAAQRRRV